MKNNVNKNNAVTILDDPCDYLDDELPEEIDFSRLKQIENPINNPKKLMVTLEPDIAKHFRSSRQLNQFLRLQLKSLKQVK